MKNELATALIALGLAVTLFLSCTDSQPPEFPSLEEVQDARQKDSSSSGPSSSSEPVSSSSSEDVSCDDADKCNGRCYNKETEFCYNKTDVVSKCGGNSYNVQIHFCCGDDVYTMSSYGCCGGIGFLLSGYGCKENTVLTKCGEKLYNPEEQFCASNGSVNYLCGGKQFDPPEEYCDIIDGKDVIKGLCGDITLNYDIQFCYNKKPYNLCGGENYNPPTQFCSSTNEVKDLCGGKEYNPATQFCYGTDIKDKCGGEEYNPTTQSCSSGIILNRCGDENYYNPATHYCDSDGQTYSCGNKPYNPSIQFCYSSSSKVGNFCGINPQKYYDPDLYGCKTGNGISGNGIYLKTPVSYEGENYDAVLIGNQVWMAKNLNYNATGSKCGNGTSLSDANTPTCDTYGRLYNWSTAMNGAEGSSANPSGVRGICPDGWHLPSVMEWLALVQFVNPSCVNSSIGECANVGIKLKATSGWDSYSGIPASTDDYGFNALPGGYSGGESPCRGAFCNLGKDGNWWTASGGGSTAYFRCMNYDKHSSGSYSNPIGNLFSVRCVKN